MRKDGLSISASTKLNDTEVRAIVDRILGERWRAVGYDHAEVTSEDDVYGEPALTVTAWLKDGSSVPVDLYSHTLLDLRDVIRAEGEERYAYVQLRRGGCRLRGRPLGSAVTADDLLDIADDLVRRETGRPRQASLKRAVSTSYYALFHALAHECVSQTVRWRFQSAQLARRAVALFRALQDDVKRLLVVQLIVKQR